LIVASYVAYREGYYSVERFPTGLLVVAMVITVFYGILRLRSLQAEYDLRSPHKEPKA